MDRGSSQSRIKKIHSSALTSQVDKDRDIEKIVPEVKRLQSRYRHSPHKSRA